MGKAFLVVANMVLLAPCIFADTYGQGSANDVQNMLNTILNFITWTIGPAVFIGGWIIFTIKLMSHDEHAWDKAKNVIIGGAMLLLARVIWSIISKAAPQ